ncbi:hypothetical protein ACOME3_003216 [Neoechinorhynchus agilis]
MSSGVKIDNECIDAFNRLKMQKRSSFVIYGFTESFDKIVVAHEETRESCPVTEQNEHWYKLISMLQDNKVGYAVTILHYEADRRPQSDLLFISWAPSGASIKQKMLAASSTAAIKPALVGIRAAVQANSKSDLELDVVLMDKFKGVALNGSVKKSADY